MDRINFINNSEPALSAETLEQLQSNIEKAIADEKQFFEWVPVLSCRTASEAPTVNYTRQIGNGCKIKINDTLSIVFVSVYLRGDIKAISSGSNYACIAGLPYSQSLDGGITSFNFNNFYKGIADGNSNPLGNFANRTIRIQQGAVRGASVEKWVVGNGFEIDGSGFYFTNE